METSVSLKLEHVFDVRIDFQDRANFQTSGGARQGFVAMKEGVVEGPRLNGVIGLTGGADFAHIRSDGVIELNAHYMIQADDGALIYVTNQGYAVPPGGALAPYFRNTARFRAPEGPHDWLNRTVVVGGGERPTPGVDRIVFRFYAVA